MKSGGDNTIKTVQAKICGGEAGECAQVIQDKATDTCGTNDECINTFVPQFAESIWNKIVNKPGNAGLTDERKRKGFVDSANNKAYATKFGRGDAHDAARDLKEKYKDMRTNPIVLPPSERSEELSPYFSIGNRFVFGQKVGIGMDSPPVDMGEGFTLGNPHDSFGGPWVVLEGGIRVGQGVFGLFYEHARGESGLIDEASDVDVPNLQAFGLFAQYNLPLHERFELFGRVGLGGLFTDGAVKRSGLDLESKEIDLAGGVLYIPITVGAKVYIVKSDEFSLSAMLDGGFLLSYSQEDTTIDAEVEGGARAPYDILRTESGFAPPFASKLTLGFEF